MKKTLRLVGVAAMVLLLAASCKKEEKNNGEKQMMTFSAGIEQTGAKTGLQSGDEAHAFKQVWTEKDQINVNGTPLTVSINPDDNTKGTFTGEVTATGKYYAVYPTSATLSGSTATFTLPLTQNYVANSYESDLAPMAAYTENNELNFKNLCGLMELSLKGDGITVTSLELSCDKPIRGQTAEYTIGSDVALAMPTDAPGNAVTMNCKTTDYPNGVTLNGTTPTSFIFVLPPVTDGDFSLKVTYSGGTKTIHLSENISIEAGKVAFNNDPYKIEAGSSAPDGFVDLGTVADNGKTLYWAMCNVGANAPQQVGNYYSWGDTNPNPQSYYWGAARNQNEYKYGWEGGSIHQFVFKYCNNPEYWDNLLFSEMDNKTELDNEDDAAWDANNSNRMPTWKEAKNLIATACFVGVENYNGTGVTGCVAFKAKNESDKGRFCTAEQGMPTGYSLSDPHAFFPAGGRKIENGVIDWSNVALLWTKTVYNAPGDNDVRFARMLQLTKNSGSDSFAGRNMGLNIRPVCEGD